MGIKKRKHSREQKEEVVQAILNSQTALHVNDLLKKKKNTSSSSRRKEKIHPSSPVLIYNHSGRMSTDGYQKINILLSGQRQSGQKATRDVNKGEDQVDFLINTPIMATGEWQRN